MGLNLNGNFLELHVGAVGQYFIDDGSFPSI